MPQNFEGYVTQFAPHKALKSIACFKLTFDESVVAHRVVRVDKLRVGCGEVSRGEKMLYSGTDPESYITEYS